MSIVVWKNAHEKSGGAFTLNWYFNGTQIVVIAVDNIF
jgi:hypothetical protein